MELVLDKFIDRILQITLDDISLLSAQVYKLLLHKAESNSDTDLLECTRQATTLNKITHPFHTNYYA